MRRQVREQFAWVMVDEYQDVSRSMAMLLQEICGDLSSPATGIVFTIPVSRVTGLAPELGAGDL